MSSNPPAELPSHRACAHCRSQKVRCLPDEVNPNVCQRCVRSGRPCTFTPLQRRKQRKRTDTRVAELEKQMHAMRTALHQKQEASGLRSASTPEEPITNREVTAEVQAPPPAALPLWTMPNSQSTDAGSLWDIKAQPGPVQVMNDVVDDGIISIDTARQLFQTYRDVLFPLCPAVAIDPAVTADDMRRTRPTLFLAMIAAAAGKDNAALSAVLEREVMHAYATRSLIQSEKSLELVQAMLISSLWYQPPHKFGQLKYYEYIHSAANMAMDLGIGSKRASNRSRESENMARSALHPSQDLRNPIITMAPRGSYPAHDSGSIENRRTFLACYFVSTGVSLSLGRPCMLRTSSYIRECIGMLEHSPDALPTDRVIAAWTTLIMIAEEGSIALSYDDLGAIASIAELRTQLLMKDFAGRLSAWYQKYNDMGLVTGALKIMYFNVRLHHNELALHVEYSPEDFRAPFRMGRLNVVADADKIPSAVLAEAVADCIACAQQVLDVFENMDIEEIRGGPVFNCVRVSFAAFVLVKLCLSASSAESRIGKIIDRSLLNTEVYLDRLIAHVRRVVGEPARRVPTIFLALVLKLREWCRHPEIIWNRTDDVLIGDLSDAERDAASLESRARIVEQSSTVGDTPHADHNKDIQTISSNSSAMGDANQLYPAETSAMDSTVVPIDRMMPDWMASGVQINLTADGSAPRMTSLQGQTMMPGFPGMGFNETYYNMMENMDILAGGGLTGLEDWSIEANEFDNSMNGLNWQSSSNAGG